MRAFSSATAAPSTAPSDAMLDSAKRAELVGQLRPLCSALYSENRTADQTVEQLLMPWQTQIAAVLTNESSPLVANAVLQTYEQGVAIACKQRELALAKALIAQMKQFSLAPHDALYVYQIRAVPLQWVSRTPQRTLDELRALELGTSWEKAVLELVRADNQPHYRKPAAERDQFHAFVRDGISQVLAAYEVEVPKDQQHIAPYNAALLAYAANGLPFAQMMRVLNRIPQDSGARRALNADTFLALLRGARWNGIPLTIDRLVKSNMAREVQQQQDEVDGGDDNLAQRRSRTAALIWDEAMRAICNSYSERFFDKRTPLDRRRIRDLQNIYLDVEAQLLRAFPDKKFARLEDHTAVYEIRVKAAALLGLPRQVHSLLNEYKALAPIEAASGQLDKSVFFKAMEIFPSVGFKRVHAQDVERVRSHADVLEAPEVRELKKAIEHLEKHVIPAKKAIMNGNKGAKNDEFRATGRELRKAQQRVVKQKKRLPDLLTRVAIEVAHQHRMQAADRSIDIILEHFVTPATSIADVHKDLDVAVGIMTQYMTAANRYATRMNQQTREIMSAQLMDRVFALLDTALGADAAPCNEPEDRAKIEQLFSLATKTAALFWCEEDLERLTRRKKAALGTTRLDATDYDRLVFMRVAQLDIDGACALLQEMHYAGTSPTPTTIHRIVTGALHKLYRSRTKKATTTDDDDVNVGDHEDDDVVALGGAVAGSGASWSTGPRRLEDVVSFLQEWYNLYRVEPLAKTVVPVFARLLAANNVWEVKRLLQILDAMDGGLPPVVEFWLEKRLAAVGKTVDDLRVR